MADLGSGWREQEVPGRGGKPHTASPDGVQRPAQVDVAHWNFDEPAVPQLGCDRKLANHRRIATRADQDFDESAASGSVAPRASGPTW